MNRGAIIILAAVLTTVARAQPAWTPPAVPGVGLVQRLGERLPVDTTWTDDTGARVRLAGCFDGRPAVLVFGYSRCPQLCSIVASGAVEALRDLTGTAGRDYRVLYVSIDPADTPRDLAALKRRDVGRYGRGTAGSGWRYLCGEADAIRAVTEAAGFHFTYDSRTRLYAHASGFLVLTPDGRIARYFFGVDFDPKEIAAALDRAEKGKTGEPVFSLLLACARGVGITGRHGVVIWGALTAGVLGTVVAVFGGIGWMLWKERGRGVGTGGAR
jgi:protein SCO1/2